MKRLLITATIAALTFSVTAEAKPNKQKKAAKQVVATQRVSNVGTRTVSVPAGRTVVRRSYSSGYYGGGYYGGRYYPYYSSGPSVSIGIGSGYPYYGYGYGYPYGYGYGYSNSYGYSGYGYSGNVVANVQARLAHRGYYHGAVDGVAGVGTRSAIARYKANHGLIADGRIDRNLLRSLGLS